MVVREEMLVRCKAVMVRFETIRLKTERVHIKPMVVQY